MAGLPTDLTTLGERLRWVRENVLRLSTHGLAEKLEAEEVDDSSNASVTRYEQGKRVPKVEYVAAIAQMAGVSLDWIVLNRQPQSEAERVLQQVREVLLPMPRELFKPLPRPSDMGDTEAGGS